MDSGHFVRALCLVLVLISFSLNPVAAQSAVQIDEIIQLTDETVYLNALDSDESNVLAIGDNGVVLLIPPEQPSGTETLVPITDEDLLAVDFHPAGNALIVGESGEIIRYDHQDRRLSNVSGTGAVELSTLTAVSWNTNGAWAYIASDTGLIWRFRSLVEGSEMVPIENTKSSTVQAIDCHSIIRLCVVVTKSDGIALIDADHQISWIGGSSVIWTDVECAFGNNPECIAVGSNQNLATIHLDDSIDGGSSMDAVVLTEAGGEFTHICAHSSDRLMVAMVPFGLIEHDVTKEDSFPWLDHADIASTEDEIATRQVTCSWGTGMDDGWILNDRGRVARFVPDNEIDNPLISSIVGYALTVVIVISVPGIVLGLIFMNSPSMQASYNRWRRRRKGIEPSLKDRREERRRKRES